MGRIRRARGELAALDIAAAEGELLEGFVVLGRRPPAFALLNRFAWGEPASWSEGTLATVAAIDTVGMQEVWGPIMRQLIALDRDDADLDVYFAAEAGVTHLLTAVCLLRALEVLTTADEAKWSAAPAALLVPDMHVVQSAVADELRHEFREVETTIRKQGFRSKGAAWRTNYSETVLAATAALEEQCWPTVQARLPDGPALSGDRP